MSCSPFAEKVGIGGTDASSTNRHQHHCISKHCSITLLGKVRHLDICAAVLIYMQLSREIFSLVDSMLD